MNCEKCSGDIALQYEKDESGKWTSFWWCNVCDSRTNPKQSDDMKVHPIDFFATFTEQGKANNDNIRCRY